MKLNNMFISLGSNQGDRKKFLVEALENISAKYDLISHSRIFTSKAVDHIDQPDFLNMVIECKRPECSAEEVLQVLLSIEDQMGRVREFKFGPRIIDIDLLLFGEIRSSTPFLTLPHPRMWERSFVVLPMQDLIGFESISKIFEIPEKFSNSARPIV